MMMIKRLQWDVGRIIGVGMWALAVIVLAGCSMVRLGYGQVDELAYRWIDGWVDFDDAQTPKAREALATALRWHRKTQLPDYAQWLAKVADDTARETTPEAVCRLNADVRERITRLSDQLLPSVVDIGVSLSDAQLAHMQKHFDESQKRFRDEYAKRNPSEREEAAFKRLVSRAETLYSSLDEAQITVLRGAAKTSTFDVALIADERAVRHRELQQLLRDARRAAQEGPRDAAVAKLRDDLKRWLQQGSASPRAAYRDYQRKTEAANCALAAQVHNVAGPTARQAAREKLKGWEGDARALMGNDTAL